MTTDRAQHYRELMGLDEAQFDRLRSLCEQYFADVPIAGRRCVDVGAGVGAYSLWLRIVEQAAAVEAMEPSLGVGGHSDIADRARARFAESGYDGLSVAQYTLQDYPITRRFEVAVSLNSINHLDEVTVPLTRPSEARDRYQAIFRKLYDLLEPGGDLVIADCARYCLERYTMRLGLPRVFTRGIDYDIHQQPSTWAQLAREAGFVDVRWRGLRSRRLRGLGKLAETPVANFLTNAAFILRARRAG